MIIDQIHSLTRYDLDDALGLETVDGSPERGSTHSELSAELFDTDLVACAVAISVEEESAYECIGIAAETGPTQFLHHLLAAM
jgi:hypothetical protein